MYLHPKFIIDITHLLFTHMFLHCTYFKKIIPACCYVINEEFRSFFFFQLIQDTGCVQNRLLLYTVPSKINTAQSVFGPTPNSVKVTLKKS